MNAQRSNHTSVPSENWDDDFEFQQGNDRHAHGTIQDTREPRLSATSSTFGEDWDNEMPSSLPGASKNVLEDRKNYPVKGVRSPLEDWSEPGPSTPTKRATGQAENWDDDFEDRPESPIQKPLHSLKTRHSYHTPPRTRQFIEPENWDDDFDAGKGDSPLPKRTRHDAYVESSDDEGEFGFAEKEEDRTVTTRTRRAMLPGLTPPPPVPAIPQSFLGSVTEPFPHSPTVSVFSIPTTSGRNSIGYTSTSRLALRPTLSGGSLAMLPPSPPIHRERRRLRKKSRPQHLDNNVFELIEEQYDPPTGPIPPSTPERSSSPPPTSSDPTSPGSTKTPLLSRIGSVKKWGVRKKRASTGPSEVMAPRYNQDEEATPRPTSSLAQTPASSKPNWFFRGPGGGLGSGSPPPRALAELRHEQSLDKMQLMPMTPPDSPHKVIKRKQSRTFEKGARGEVEQISKPSLFSAVRRPSSMQVPNGKSGSLRQTSYGSSIGRSSSKAIDSTEGSVESSEKPAQEGSRSFMGSVRRISLVTSKKHRRNKSSAIDPMPPHPDLPSQPNPIPTQGRQTPLEQLLPPIELQPPSPPRVVGGITTAHSAPITISAGIESLIVPSSMPSSLPSRGNSSNINRNSPSKAPSSPQSASLGRSTHVPSTATTNISVPRRNSLGDLKIPARISQAQIGLKRDLGMVREFAASVEKLKELQMIYYALVSEIQAILDSELPSRAASPTIFYLARPGSRARSNTNPRPQHDPKQLATAFYTISLKYRVPWECAELLIELGGGTPTPVSPPSSSVSAPAIQMQIDSRKSRERAVTLSGEEAKPIAASGSSTATQPNLAWRASTGRHDLSQRQLVLLRDMLHNVDNSHANASLIPEEGVVNRYWRWGDAMSSTVTLPSEESIQDSVGNKKRRSGRLGMSGLRDMLRSLKRSHSDQPPIPASTSSLSTNSSHDSRSRSNHPHAHVVANRRRSKASTGPDSMRSAREHSPTSPYNGSSLTHKASPRRPSLASIFRLGQKNKVPTSGPDMPISNASEIRVASSGSSAAEEEDWDRIDSASDLDAAAKALGIDGSATIKGKRGRSPYLHEHNQEARPVTPKRAPSASQTSFWGESSPRSIRPMRSTRLSNVEEHVDSAHREPRSKSKSKNRISLPRESPPPSKSHKAVKSGSVRSAPPQPLDDRHFLPDFKLAMTPENIKPLLENAKEVHIRLIECIKEVQVLLNPQTLS